MIRVKRPSHKALTKAMLYTPLWGRFIQNKVILTNRNYLKKLKSCSGRHRKRRDTAAEKYILKKLKLLKIKNIRYQQVIHPFIVDIYLPWRGLIVEIYEPWHFKTQDKIKRDKERENYLRKLGFYFYIIHSESSEQKLNDIVKEINIRFPESSERHKKSAVILAETNRIKHPDTGFSRKEREKYNKQSKKLWKKVLDKYRHLKTEELKTCLHRRKLFWCVQCRYNN